MTFGHGLVLRTKLLPPRLRRWNLIRKRLSTRLTEAADYRLTLLEAPTGYGKSTLLAGWQAQTQKAFVWYNLGQADADPFSFLLHLIYAFRERFADLGEQTLGLLENEWKEAATPPERQTAAHQALRLFINELYERLDSDTFIVFDDFHLIEPYNEVLALAQELVAAAPSYLHIIIATRQRPYFEQLPRWIAQQEVLQIGKEALAFQPDEIAQLFEERYGYALSSVQVARLAFETEGWIIGLQMIWQNLQAAGSDTTEENQPLDRLLADLPRNSNGLMSGLLGGLFDYLAQEVLSRQTADDQRFLLESSCLRPMIGSACDYVLNLPEGQGEVRLRRLSEAGLFIIMQGELDARIYRYHHLFGEFLYSRLLAVPNQAGQLHRRAAQFYEQQNQPAEALHHFLAGKDWSNATRLMLDRLGQTLIETGQFERLEHYLMALPEESGIFQIKPGLLLLRGDCQRLTSRFDEALQSYRHASEYFQTQADQAGRAWALRGRAQVYLDTVQPAAAEEWLEQALAVAQATGYAFMQATLLRDLAENKLNRGRPWEAEELHRQARQLLGLHGTRETGPEDVRILLRSGRLSEMAEALEYGDSFDDALVEGKRRPGRSHREKLLLMALLDAIKGQGAQGILRAEQGIRLARELHTPFTEAVAMQRLGHALTVNGQPAEALEVYHQGQVLGNRLKVRRLQAECLMGLCLLHGRGPQGDLTAARQAGEEGIVVARKAGDEWIEGFLRVSLAAALVEHGEETEAIGVAQTARALLENCGDRFGQLVARLWLALAAGNQRELSAIQQESKHNGYDFLLHQPTMFGPKSQRLLAIIGSDNSRPPAVNKSSGDFPGKQYPPALRVVTLGSFGVWRPDGSELEPRDWQRDKARQLFQVLLTRRDKGLSKEQILNILWPDHDQNAAEAGFKVALNALMQALEPTRSSRAQSSYIERTGAGSSLAYALRLKAGQLWLDAVEFEHLASLAVQAEKAGFHQAEVTLGIYDQALKLYQGDFLPGCLYEDWAAPERERLLALFLTTAERVAHLRAARQEWEQCMAACRLILSHDNCWEEAYRLIMLAYWKSHNRAAAVRTYEKCVETLRDELGVTPLPETEQLYRDISFG